MQKKLKIITSENQVINTTLSNTNPKERKIQDLQGAQVPTIISSNRTKKSL